MMVKPTLRYDLAVAATTIRDIAAHALLGKPVPYTAGELNDLAESLDVRHDHADPCDDTACPCRAAEHDHMIDMGYRGPEGA